MAVELWGDVICFSKARSHTSIQPLMRMFSVSNASKMGDGGGVKVVMGSQDRGQRELSRDGGVSEEGI